MGSVERNQERENSALYVQLPKMSVFEKTSSVLVRSMMPQAHV